MLHDDTNSVNAEPETTEMAEKAERRPREWSTTWFRAVNAEAHESAPRSNIKRAPVLIRKDARATKSSVTF